MGPFGSWAVACAAGTARWLGRGRQLNPPRRSPFFTVLLGSLIGCAQTPRQRESATVEPAVLSKGNLAPVQSHNAQPMETELEPTADAPELQGPQPVDVFIRRALAENRTVQAAYHNVQSLEDRIPQVTALDDPVASNAVFPIPERRAPVLLDGLQPLQPDARAAIPLVRHVTAAGGGGRAGRADRPGRAGRRRSSTRSPP